MTTPFVERFVDRMRVATRKHHSPGQLKGTYTPPQGAPTLHGFMHYLSHHREIHRVLRREFPIITRTDYVEALDCDIWQLELDMWQNDMPLLLPDTYDSTYARYIDGLSLPKKGCHWYNTVFAHLVGGNRQVAAAASTVLPPGWIQSSFFFKQADTEEIEALREAFELEAGTWSDTDRKTCLLETGEAFSRASHLNTLIFTCEQQLEK